MMSPVLAQRVLDFDLATLTACIATLRPKPIQSLFRGLLIMAAQMPQCVIDIDADGWVMMNGSFSALAPWAGVTERTLQRCRDRAVTMQLVQHHAGINSESEWLFRLPAVLPASAVDWFRDVVENGRMSPRQNENVTPTFRKCHPDKTTNVTPTFSNRTSYCFKETQLSLAQLAARLDEFGFSVSGTNLDQLAIDSAAFSDPRSIEAIYRAVSQAGLFADSAMHRRRFFIMAAIAVSTKADFPWSWIRSAVRGGWWLEKRETAAQRSMAETWLRVADGRDAAELIPAITGDQAWAKVTLALRKYSVHHEIDRIREMLGPDLHAAARTVGLGKIADRNEKSEHSLRNALTAAWEDHLRAKELTTT